jgi:hypothetical protein
MAIASGRRSGSESDAAESIDRLGSWMVPSAARARDYDGRLIELAAGCRHGPLRFVLAAYPWGEDGGPLERHSGPDHWQKEVLGYIRDHVGYGRSLRIAIAGGVISVQVNRPSRPGL